MAIVIPEGFGLVAFKFGLTGDPEEMVTTCGAVVTDSGEEAVGEFGALFISCWGLSGWSSSYTYRGARLYLGQASGPPSVHEASVALEGINASSFPPQNVALLIRKNSALGGRANRGRMYFPPFNCAEGSISVNGMLDNTFMGNFQDGLNDFNAGAEWVVLHDEASPVTTPTPITTMVLQPQIATQRRRLRP